MPITMIEECGGETVYRLVIGTESVTKYVKPHPLRILTDQPWNAVDVHYSVPSYDITSHTIHLFIRTEPIRCERCGRLVNSYQQHEGLLCL